jgi:hypothetical protein
MAMVDPVRGVNGPEGAGGARAVDRVTETRQDQAPAAQEAEGARAADRATDRITETRQDQTRGMLSEGDGREELVVTVQLAEHYEERGSTVVETSRPRPVARAREEHRVEIKDLARRFVLNRVS